MDTFIDDVIFEILKYYKSVRCINKNYYNRMLVTYGNSKITVNEIINYNQTFCIYYLKNYDLLIHVFEPANNHLWLLKTYSIMYQPHCISPNFYNNNVTLLHYTQTVYNEAALEKVTANNNKYDKKTLDTILPTRFQHINTNFKVDVTIKCDFDIMYSKLCQIMVLLRENVEKINSLLDQKFQFRGGKLIDRHDEFRNYINLLDSIIGSY